MKKFLSLILAAIMVFGLIPAAFADDVVEIEFWHSWEAAWRDSLEALIVEFQNQNPGIKVNMVYAGSYSESNQKLMAAHAAGAVPTVQQTSGSNIMTFAENGVIYLLDEYVAANGDDLSVFSQGMLDAYAYNGKQYGLPGCISLVPTWYYNKTFAEAEGIEMPTKWEDFDAFLRKATIKDEAGNTVRYGAEFAGWGIDYVNPMLREYGVKFFLDDAQTESGFDCEEIRTFAAQMQAWSNEGLIKWAYGSNASNNMRQAFIDGNAFCVFHTCALYDLYNTSFKTAGWDLGVLFPPEGVNAVAGLGGSGFTVMAKASPEQREYGYKLVRFLTDTACNMIIIKNTGYLPVTQTCVESDECALWLQENPELVHLYDHLNELVASPSTAAWSDIGTKVVDNLARIIVDGEDVEATISFMCDEITEILEDM